MKTERRWLKSMIAAAADETQAALPFARGMRRRPASLIDNADQTLRITAASLAAVPHMATAAR